MKRRRSLLVLLLALSCVPDGAPVEPRGGVGVLSQPSPATLGEPFMSPDGIKVTIRRLVAYAMFNSLPPGGQTREDGEVGERLCMWNASAPTDKIVMRAVKEGLSDVRFELQGRGRFAIDGSEVSFYLNVDVEKPMEDRFRRLPEGLEDVARELEPPLQVGMVLIAQLEKPKTGERVTIDIAITGQHSEQDPAQMTVVANALSYTTLDVHAERFFNETEATLMFDADTNHDGIVSPAELRAKTFENRLGEEESLLTRLSSRTSEILTFRRSPK